MNTIHKEYLKRYAELNISFLQKVDEGAEWEELQGLENDMKSIADHLRSIYPCDVPFTETQVGKQAA